MYPRRWRRLLGIHGVRFTPAPHVHTQCGTASTYAAHASLLSAPPSGHMRYSVIDRLMVRRPCTPYAASTEHFLSGCMVARDLPATTQTASHMLAHPPDKFLPSPKSHRPENFEKVLPFPPTQLHRRTQFFFPCQPPHPPAPRPPALYLHYSHCFSLPPLTLNMTTRWN